MCYANGGHDYIYIVKNGGKTDAGSGGKRGKKQTFSPCASHQPGLKGLFVPAQFYQPGLKGIPTIRKKHTDRVFLSSACEPLDQGCVSSPGP